MLSIFFLISFRFMIHLVNHLFEHNRFSQALCLLAGMYSQIPPHIAS